MKSWKTIALAAALVGAAGLGASIAPIALAQSRARVAPRAEVFTFAGASRIGVSIRDIEPDDAKGKGLSGAVIESVDDDSPAAKAGLKTGDIVVEFDGERVRSVRQFTRVVGETPAGRSVAAAVMRDGQRVTVTVTPVSGNAFGLFGADRWAPFEGIWPTPPAIPARPASPAHPVPPSPETPPHPVTPALPPSLETFIWRGGNQLGITVSELPAQLAEYFGTKDGVLVSSVSDNSAAAKSGVKAGDVITSVNGNAVDDASELRRRLQSLDDGEEFSLGIVRDKKTMTLKGKLERPAQRRRTTRTTV